MIRIEPFSDGNVPDLLRWFANPANRRFQITKLIDKEKARKLITSTPTKKVYCIKLDRQPIGYCMLKRLDSLPEVGINIDQPHWGKGYGKEALKLLEQEAKQLGIAKLYLRVFRDNLRAIRLYENAGYIDSAELQDSDGRMRCMEKIL